MPLSPPGMVSDPSQCVPRPGTSRSYRAAVRTGSTLPSEDTGGHSQPDTWARAVSDTRGPAQEREAVPLCSTRPLSPSPAQYS